MIEEQGVVIELNMESCILLPVISMYLLLLPGSAWSLCCPTCSLRSVDPLNAQQIEQIRSNQELIQQIKLNPLLLHNRYYQRSVVTLTKRQRGQILRNLPDLFLSEEDFRKSLMTRGRVTVEESPQGMYSRQKRQTTATRVCEPLAGVDALQLALNLDGQVVEIIQMPDQDLNQWILEESCDDLESSPPAPLACGLVDRVVPGVFVTLSEPFIFDHAYVVVQSCATVYV
ncbi:uncharacterized protein LOC119723160 [Patiria miniata]|uniref:Uncharacterized protein n=1 Tax=Patiria miniata TaxID=46514 RepID=A0A913ZF06_PATMI|nr:uncharacterized protein LOC119723160 [Patiria miniata]